MARVAASGGRAASGCGPTSRSGGTSWPCWASRAAAVPRRPGPRRRAVAVDRVDAQPQRHPDAGVPDAARGGRHRRPARAAAVVGPRRAGLPGGRRRRPGGRGRRLRDERRLRALGIARARTTTSRWSRRTSATPASRRPSRAAGRVAGRPGGRRSAVRRADGAAFPVRPPDPRPRRAVELSTSSTSWRCTSRRPSGAGATSRCRCCTRTGSSASWTPPPTARPARCGARAPRGRPVHAGDARRRARGDRAARRLAGAGGRPGLAGAGSIQMS